MLLCLGTGAGGCLPDRHGWPSVPLCEPGKVAINATFGPASFPETANCRLGALRITELLRSRSGAGLTLRDFASLLGPFESLPDPLRPLALNGFGEIVETALGSMGQALVDLLVTLREQHGISRTMLSGGFLRGETRAVLLREARVRAAEYGLRLHIRGPRLKLLGQLPAIRPGRWKSPSEFLSAIRTAQQRFALRTARPAIATGGPYLPMPIASALCQELEAERRVSLCCGEEHLTLPLPDWIEGEALAMWAIVAHAWLLNRAMIGGYSRSNFDTREKIRDTLTAAGAPGTVIEGVIQVFEDRGFELLTVTYQNTFRAMNRGTLPPEGGSLKEAIGQVPPGTHVVGIDVGGTSVKLGLFEVEDGRLRALRLWSRPWKPHDAFDHVAFFEKLVRKAEQLIGQPVDAIGISWAGPVTGNVMGIDRAAQKIGGFSSVLKRFVGRGGRSWIDIPRTQPADLEMFSAELNNWLSSRSRASRLVNDGTAWSLAFSSLPLILGPVGHPPTNTGGLAACGAALAAAASFRTGERPAGQAVATSSESAIREREPGS